MKYRLQRRRCVMIIALFLSCPRYVLAWNMPGHMLSGAIAYQILGHENPLTIRAVRNILQKHPWFESRWQTQLGTMPEEERDQFLFMLAARWADDIRTQDKEQRRALWHYINWPVKPGGQPESVRTKPPGETNILTNERSVNSRSAPAERAIALTWLFHLSGDVHQPLHTAQLFTVDYPNGDRGGNEICVRPAPERKAIDLHRFWDAAITSSRNVNRLQNQAIALRNQPEFARNRLTELVNGDFEAWAKESFEIATKIAYLNGTTLGTPKELHKDCNEIDAATLPAGYAQNARRIADRRMMLAGYRLADLLRRIVTK